MELPGRLPASSHDYAFLVPFVPPGFKLRRQGNLTSGGFLDGAHWAYTLIPPWGSLGAYHQSHNGRLDDAGDQQRGSSEVYLWRAEAIAGMSDVEKARLVADSLAGRTPDGVASAVDRVAALGNGQVPAVAALAWRVLAGEL